MSVQATGAPAYSKREQRGWYMYDWANSGFSSTVVTLFLGPYLTALAKAGADPAGYVYPLGVQVDARSFWGYMISLSVLSQVLFLPVVGAIADYGRRKKQFLAATTYLGAAATMAMFFLEGTDYLLGGGLFLISNLAFGASMVLYNSFLPEIAAPEDRDDVSSKGWGIGYVGGGVLLALNLVLFSQASSLGLTNGQAVRINLWSAGAWWAVFAIPTLVAVKNRQVAKKLAPGETAIGASFRQLAHTLADVRKYPQTMTFLLAYLLYNDAIQTVITLASQFGNDELKIPLSTMTVVILMVQFVAFFGAIAFNWLAAAINAKRAVVVSLVIWTGVLIYIYLAVTTTLEFFIMAAIVAMVMGGSQALSRSLYSLMIPKSKEAEYFSIYEISDKGTSWLCPLLFGLALQFTRSYRLAILSLILFFLLGLFVLLRVDVRRASAEAGNP